MVLNRDGFHYRAVKKVSALIRGITSNHVGDFLLFASSSFIRTKVKLEWLKKVYENRDFCSIVMFAEYTKI